MFIQTSLVDFGDIRQNANWPVIFLISTWVVLENWFSISTFRKKVFASNYLLENNCSPNTYLLINKYSLQEISTPLKLVWSVVIWHLNTTTSSIFPENIYSLVKPVYLGTQAHGHLVHLGTWVLGYSRHSGTWALRHSRHFT